MTDINRLKVLAERAEALYGAPSLEHVFAITKFREAVEPKAILGLIAEIERLRGEIDVYEDGMRSLACSLGSGGYNADTLTAAQLVDKVKWGVDNLAETQGRLMDEIDGLLAQHSRDSAELRALCQARDDARKEKDRVKAENEALRETVDQLAEMLRS